MNPSSLETIYRVYEENKRLSEENEALRLEVQVLKASLEQFENDDIYTLENADQYHRCACSEETETEYVDAYTRLDMPTCSECGGRVSI